MVTLVFADGAFVPDIAKYSALCSKAKEREYRYQQKVYYSTLLREILINRRVCHPTCFYHIAIV